MRRFLPCFLIAWASLLTSPVLWAQAPAPPSTPPPSAASPAPATPPPRCEGDSFRQFDFWLGTWDVRSAANAEQPPSTNVISREYGDCLIREVYSTPSGFAGTSLNFYSRASGRWHQSWIDNTGNGLLLTGGLEDGSMVMASDPDLSPRHRITWTPNDDGSVRQLWESSSDQGKTWTVAFDGLYTRKE